MPGAERRIEPRTDVRWHVRIHHPKSGCVEGEVSNISLYNVLFVTSARLEAGEGVQLEIEIGPDRWIQCITRIIRMEPASRRRYAYGAIILHFAGSYREMLANRLKELHRVSSTETHQAA
jgi:hypothetical protein